MDPLPATRQSLILRLRERSRDGWAEFVRIYERAILDSCRRRGLQEADARDVTQEVLAAVDARAATWDGDPSKGTFRGWLFRVARNVAVDRIAERARHAAIGGGGAADGTGERRLDELPETDAARGVGFWIDYRRRLTEWAAEQVRPDVHESSWRAFWRTAVEGRAPEDVARELGTTVGNVYTARCRVFARMRALVADLEPPDGDPNRPGADLLPRAAKRPTEPTEPTEPTDRRRA